MTRYEDAAASWLAHLRGGGGTPWSEWSRVTPQPAASGGMPLPGAARLEVVRRLALLHGPSTDLRFDRLAELVLHGSTPGRGELDQPLSWPTGRPTGFGAPPVDPGQIRPGGLLRVAVGVLVDLLEGVPAATEPASPGRRRPWHQAFRLVGAPVDSAQLRAGFAAAGRVEGGRRPRVLVVGAPFDVLLRQAWSARVQRGAAVSWHGFLSRCAGRDRTPAGVDLGAIADAWADRVGADRVRVLLSGGQDRFVDQRAAAGLLGGLPFALPAADPALVRLSDESVEVLRRLNSVLAVRTEQADRRSVRLAAVDLLPRQAAVTDAITVPAGHEGWARRAAERLSGRLGERRYAVHGDPRHVADWQAEGRPGTPSLARALDLTLRACLTAAEWRGV